MGRQHAIRHLYRFNAIHVFNAQFSIGCYDASLGTGENGAEGNVLHIAVLHGFA
jgi:hypothetical protein